MQYPVSHPIITQLTSDDVPHDETLSSSIAVLNLTLQHLDIDAGEEEVGVAVKACGDFEYMRVGQALMACRKPKDKAAAIRRRIERDDNYQSQGRRQSLQQCL